MVDGKYSRLGWTPKESRQQKGNPETLTFQDPRDKLATEAGEGP